MPSLATHSVSLSFSSAKDFEQTYLLLRSPIVCMHHCNNIIRESYSTLATPNHMSELGRVLQCAFYLGTEVASPNPYRTEPLKTWAEGREVSARCGLSSVLVMRLQYKNLDFATYVGCDVLLIVYSCTLVCNLSFLFLRKVLSSE